MNPSGNACLSKELTRWINLWIDPAGHFSNFTLSTVKCVEQLPAVPGNHPFLSDFTGFVDWSRDNTSFWVLLKRLTTCQACSHDQAKGHACRYGAFSFYGRWWGSIVHVIHLNTDSRWWGWLEYRGPWALSRIMHVMWMHHFSSTRSPLVPYLMRAPFLG